MANTNQNYPGTKTISEFKSFLSGGGARTNLFEVEISFPDVANISGEVDVVNTGRYLIKAAALPASNLNVLPVAFRGRVLNVAGDRQFETWTIRFINDTDFKLRTAFERWSNAINNVASNRGETEPALYMSDMTVYQLDRNGRTLRKYVLYDCYPSSISRQDLDYDTEAVQEFSVELQMLYWEAFPGDFEKVSVLTNQEVATDLE